MFQGTSLSNIGTRQSSYRVLLILLIAAVLLQGCSQAAAPAAAKEKPAVLEPIEGSKLKRVVLTEKAAERIGVETVLIDSLAPQTGSDKTQLASQKENQQAIPYAAVIYDIQGDTWLYTNPQPLTFVRQQIRVDHIDAEWAYLSEKLPAGTSIVTVGVAELYGAETGVGK